LDYFDSVGLNRDKHIKVEITQTLEIKNKHILVVGLGKTGNALVRFLNHRGARVTVTDQADAELLGDALDAIRDCRVRLELGGHRLETFLSADLIVLSPGVPHTIDPVRRARAANIPITGEIELAYRFLKTPIIAITGTNGKSTTTLLVGQMLTDAGFDVFVGGNLGTPLIEYADQGGQADFAVVEISSFQLDTIDIFRPRAAVLLNITADHLDRYDDFAGYVQSKGRIFKNQAPDDFAVINYADPATRELAPAIRAKLLPFNIDPENGVGAWLADEEIGLRLPDGGEVRLDCRNIPLLGAHNRENIAAAALAASAVGAPFASIQETVRRFQGLPHRMTPVGTFKGIQFVDDSKATNVDAVVRALASFSTPVILIMGGREKGGAYSALKSLFPGRIKHLVLMGEAADSIAAELGAEAPFSRVATMAEAVRTATAQGSPGDTVLLSPACASFDMYESYAHRGDDFANCVMEMGTTGNE
jgi:UDP-N-acetylmuramoylalanine--D-glutamate ligase